MEDLFNIKTLFLVSIFDIIDSLGRGKYSDKDVTLLITQYINSHIGIFMNIRSSFGEVWGVNLLDLFLFNYNE